MRFYLVSRPPNLQYNLCYIKNVLHGSGTAHLHIMEDIIKRLPYVCGREVTRTKSYLEIVFMFEFESKMQFFPFFPYVNCDGITGLFQVFTQFRY